ncbi:hypothetical protein D3C72_1844440 [compost metagenome]
MKPIPAPIRAPIKVCELEQGIPKYQVPKFQIIAANNTERTRQAPTETGSAIKVSRGTNLSIPIATAIPPAKTPRKFQKPDQGMATIGLSALV